MGENESFRREKWIIDQPSYGNGGCNHPTVAAKKYISPQRRIEDAFMVLPDDKKRGERGNKPTSDSLWSEDFFTKVSSFARNKRQRNQGVEESHLEEEGISVSWIEKMFQESLSISSDSEEEADLQISIRRPSNVRPRTRQRKRQMEERETEVCDKGSKRGGSMLQN